MGSIVKRNSTLLIVAILAVAMLSVGLVVLPVQQASAQDTSFNFNSRLINKCSGILPLYIVRQMPLPLVDRLLVVQVDPQKAEVAAAVVASVVQPVETVALLI